MKRMPESSWKESMAYAPRFFLSMLFTLLAFAVVSYIATGSIVTALIQTVICAVLIQIGYFLVMLYLVWRTARARQAEAGSRAPGKDEAEKSQLKVPVAINKAGHSKF